MFTTNSTFLAFSPNLAETVENQQRWQKKYHDSPTSKLCEFTNGYKVQVQDFSGKKGKWEEGTIEENTGTSNLFSQNARQV